MRLITSLDVNHKNLRPTIIPYQHFFFFDRLRSNLPVIYLYMKNLARGDEEDECKKEDEGCEMV